MLKVLYQKLRLKCKGSLNYNQANLSRLQLKKARKLNSIGKYIVQGIPVLSIFALVGIIAFSVMLPSNNLTRLFGIDKLFGLDNLLEDSNKAYAEEGISPLADTSASLTVDDGKIKDTIFATNGEFAYASHKITVEANNIKSYSLTLSKTAGLTGPSTVNDANNTTPENMDNQWGYAWIGENDNPTTASYKALTASNNLADINIDNNHNLSGSKQLVFGAKFGNAAASGTYHAEATLSLVATPRIVTNYIVNVNCNSGTGCTSNLNTSSDAESYVYTISSTTPTRSGYKFLGYNTTNTTTANANYAPGKTVTLTAASPTLNLYAIWQQDIQTIKTITNMQQMTAAICAASAIGDTNTLTDTRDGATYAVKKMNNEQCWMTQNLRIVNKTISSTDSDMTSGSFTIPASSTSGFSSNTASNAYYGNSITYGAYYTWCAATAGTCSSATSGGADASASICPKGWKLPKSGTGTTNDFAKVAGISTATTANQWSDASNISFANSTLALNGATWPATGYRNNSSSSDVNNTGYYWSRTVYSSPQSYYLTFRDGDFAPANFRGERHFGCSIRCVAYSS